MIDNIYGESAGGKYYSGPILFNSLIEVGDNTSPTNDFGVDFDFKKTPQNIIKTPQMAESIIEFILITSFYFTHSNNCVTEPLVNSIIG